MTHIPSSIDWRTTYTDATPDQIKDSAYKAFNQFGIEITHQPMSYNHICEICDSNNLEYHTADHNPQAESYNNPAIIGYLIKNAEFGKVYYLRYVERPTEKDIYYKNMFIFIEAGGSDDE